VRQRVGAPAKAAERPPGAWGRQQSPRARTNCRARCASASARQPRPRSGRPAP